MEKSLSSQLLSLINFTKSFHLYSRYQISKTLKSPLIYGEGFGDAKILKMAKEDFLKHEKEYQAQDKSEVVDIDEKIPLDSSETPYGGIFAFEDKSLTESHTSVFSMELFASHKKISEFTGKDYVLDISPESIHIIFPDLSFVISIQTLQDISWEDARAELQESQLIGKDIAHLSGEAVSLDELRKKLKDTKSTDGALIDLRKKMYAIANVINESFQAHISQYEK